MSSMAPAAHTRGTRITMGSAVGAIRWGLDRMLSVAYGVVYDYVYERFTPYQRLQTEVRQLVEAGSPSCGDRRDVRVLEVACGPGHFTCREYRRELHAREGDGDGRDDERAKEDSASLPA